MTDQDLLSWLLQRYFDDWEVEGGKAILDKNGMEPAVEHMRKHAADSCRGACGPGIPRYETRSGKVAVWRAEGEQFFREPDLEYDLAKLCCWKLESLYQLKML